MYKNEIRLNNLSAEKKMTPQEMKNLKGGSSSCYAYCCYGDNNTDCEMQTLSCAGSASDCNNYDHNICTIIYCF